MADRRSTCDNRVCGSSTVSPKEHEGSHTFRSCCRNADALASFQHHGAAALACVQDDATLAIVLVRGQVLQANPVVKEGTIVTQRAASEKKKQLEFLRTHMASEPLASHDRIAEKEVIIPAKLFLILQARLGVLQQYTLGRSVRGAFL
eukprot:7376416-Prymnesium_polylepis.1